jgi:CRP-like cAMP-binding protein
MGHPLKDFVVPYRKGEIVFREGDPGSEMFIIQAGLVEIYRLVNGEKGFKRVFERGDFFGEMSLLEQVPRSATAEVVEDAEIIIINAGTFHQMIQSNIEIAVRMLRKLSGRLRETTDELENALLLQGMSHMPKPAELPAAPAPRKEPDEKPPVLAQFLVEGSLRVFHIYKDVSLIGRRDPVTGIVPDVDLTDEDVKRSVSRRHAKLIHSNGQFYLVEEVGTLNGTFIGGKRIPTGILTPIKSGTQVGFGTLRLKFVERSAQKEGA